MSGRAPRIAATLATAALLAGATGTVAASVDQGTDPAQVTEPDWMRALRIRSEALNRIYRLAPMHALEIRGEAMNRMYDLGDGEPSQAGGS